MRIKFNNLSERFYYAMHEFLEERGITESDGGIIIDITVTDAVLCMTVLSQALC